jgi:hypothetical protein
MLITPEEDASRRAVRAATMHHNENTTETAPRDLLDAIEQVRAGVSKIEFWAGALKGFASPIPDYEPGNWAYSYVALRRVPAPSA